MTDTGESRTVDAAVERYAGELRRQLGLTLRLAPTHPGVERILGELLDHVEDLIAERIEEGQAPAEATRAALATVGHPRALASAYRASGAPRFACPEDGGRLGLPIRLAETGRAVLRESAVACRNLARTPGYAAAFVITLGLGIGANTAIFSVVHGIWLRPLPHADGDRLVYLRHSARATGIDNVYFSVPEIEDVRTRASSFDGVAEFSSMTFTVHGLDEPRRLEAGVVTGNYFEVMGLDAIAGRIIASSDDGEGAAPVAVLTDRFWRSAFGSDPAAIGRTLRMDGVGVEIVGVLEPAPPYPEHTDLYVNMVSSPHHLGATMTQDRVHRMTEVFARLAPDVTLERAAVEVDAIAESLHAEHPAAYDPSQGYGISVTPLKEQLASRARPTMLVLLAVTGLVLIIACANVANLTLTRVMRRQAELALRVSLGASAWRIRRQLLLESLIPSVAGACLGCLVAYASVDLLTPYAARYSARASEIAVDGAVLGVALLVAVLAALLFALLPSLPGRSTALRPDGTRIAGGASGRRVQRVLVVSQVAVCCVLLVGAGLLLRTLLNLQTADGGLDQEEVLALEVPSPLERGPNERRAYYQTVLEKARSLPGVRTAAFGFRIPFTELPSGPLSAIAAVELELEGEPLPRGWPLPRGDFRPVSPEYFDTVGLRLLRGRIFDEGDEKDAPRVVVISRAMEKHHFGEREAVGRRLAWRDEGLTRYGGVSADWRRIVGVVSDANDYGMTTAPPHVVYQPLAQVPWADALLVRTPTPAVTTASLVSMLREVEPERPIVRVATLAQVYADDIRPQRLNAALVGSFALLALVISSVGVGGVLAFGVSQRAKEMGIRVALGAGRGRLLAMVIAEGGTLSAVGLLAGGAVAFGAARLVRGLLFGVTATDVVTFAGVCLVMMGVAVGASLAPAWRASRVDPAATLRAD
jgi:predicted permease